MPFNIEDLAEKIANKVAKKVGPQYRKKEKTSAIPFNPSAKLSIQSSNLIELLDEVPDFELLFEENSRYCGVAIVQRFYLLLKHRIRLRLVDPLARPMEVWPAVFTCQMIYTNNLLLVSATNGTTRNKPFINIFLPKCTTTLCIT